MKLKLLLVDDEMLVLDAIQNHLLFEENLEVMTAFGGVSGLKTWQEQKPDLTLLDLRMPELDGLEVLRGMKETGNLARHPVIILSGHATAPDRVVCREEGAFDVWEKPLDFARLEGFLEILRIHRRNFA